MNIEIKLNSLKSGQDETWKCFCRELSQFKQPSVAHLQIRLRGVKAEIEGLVTYWINAQSESATRIFQYLGSCASSDRRASSEEKGRVRTTSCRCTDAKGKRSIFQVIHISDWKKDSECTVITACKNNFLLKKTEIFPFQRPAIAEATVSAPVSQWVQPPKSKKPRKALLQWVTNM